MDVSIVVTTFQRQALLDLCLRSLRDQRNRHGRTEIVVVDNCPQGSARELCERHRHEFEPAGIGFKYVNETRPGISHGRNRGIEETQHEIICWIDDDEEAQPGWLDRLTAPFVEIGPSVAMVGGEVEPNFGDASRPSWLVDELLHAFSCRWGWDTEPRFLDGHEWFGEGNCAIRRSVLGDRRFRTDLGRSGGALGGSEGIVYLELRAAGHAAYYAPDAKVSHFVHPDRLNQRWLLNRMLQAGISDARAHRFSPLNSNVLNIKIHLPSIAGLDPESMDPKGLTQLSMAYYQTGYAFGRHL
ncbi:glycosyltransferase family 2 protein [Arenibaculum pallidiluteum]|uniref:glycosyltransferase family 2 protein n=1 Tax=Arenibaculum pallidiluteum TaxID=2812559 RepID=UPI001A96E621|nr:glycosyltransferase [Arenibaculum pallidiluteum]